MTKRMKTFKIILACGLMTLFMGLTACGSDDKDEPAAQSGGLVGMWQLVESNMRIVHSDADPTGVVFQSDNTGYWAHFKELEDRDSFTYVYDSQKGTVTMTYSSSNGGKETYTIKSLTSTEMSWTAGNESEKFKRYK